MNAECEERGYDDVIRAIFGNYLMINRSCGSRASSSSGRPGRVEGLSWHSDWVPLVSSLAGYKCSSCSTSIAISVFLIMITQ